MFRKFDPSNRPSQPARPLRSGDDSPSDPLRQRDPESSRPTNRVHLEIFIGSRKWMTCEVSTKWEKSTASNSGSQSLRHPRSRKPELALPIPKRSQAVDAVQTPPAEHTRDGPEKGTGTRPASLSLGDQGRSWGREPVPIFLAVCQAKVNCGNEFASLATVPHYGRACWILRRILAFSIASRVKPSDFSVPSSVTFNPCRSATPQ